MTLPKNYTEIYDFYLRQVELQPDEARTLAFQVLSWLSHAVDTLSIEAIQSALSMQQGSVESPEEAPIDAEVLVSICCNFVWVDRETKTIRLLHETAEEYLRSIRSTKFPGGHAAISVACLNYLSLDKFSDTCRLQTGVEERSLRDPFYEYAAKNWSKHVLLGDLELQLQESIVNFLESRQRLSTDETMARHRHSAWGTDRSSPWTDWNRLSLHRRDTPLHAAATYGLRKTVTFLLRDRGYVVDQLNTFGETALHRAAQVGQTTTMDELILNRADLNATVQHHYLGKATPMILASACLQLNAVRVLLNHGLDINTRDSEKRLTPLHFAASMDTNLTRFLLDYGADANIPAFQSPVFPELAPMMSLHFCAYFAHAYGGACDRMKLLLDNGAYLNLRNGSGNTALHIAILGGHLDLAHVLLEAEADMYLANRQDKSPIQLAKELGHFSWFKKWIPPPFLHDILQQTPALSQAIWANDIPLVRQLLE
jgi:ankyrin repeat protein